jgi:proline iminopeptidase
LEVDKETARKLAQSWNTWENALLQRSFAGAPASPSSPQDADKLIDKYKIQSHYLQNLCFFPEEGLLPHLSSIQKIQIDLLQGRLDWVCRPESSWDIHHKIPHSRLQWVESAGHGIFETPMVDCMVSAIHSSVASVRKPKSN